MLAGMRFVMEVRDEDEDRLQELAIDAERSFRQQAAFYLHLKIVEEYARFKQRLTAEQAVA